MSIPREEEEIRMRTRMDLLNRNQKTSNKNELTQGEEKIDPLEKDPQQSESTISPVPEDDPKLVKKNKVREMAGKFVGSSTVQTAESVRQQIAARRQKQVEEDQKRRVAAETKWNRQKRKSKELS
jgi:hypothetical protein